MGEHSLRSEAIPAEAGWLVLTDVDAIQSFVFSSVRMATIVGASRLIADADDTCHESAMKDGASLSVCSGGVGLFVFTAEESAKSFAKQVKSRVHAHLPGGHTTVSQPIEFTAATFVDNRNTALADIEDKKRIGFARPEFIQPGLARNCEACGQEPAVEKQLRPDGELWRLGRACAAKYAARNRALNDQVPLFGIQENQRHQYELALDFNKLAGEDDYLALIVIDGDGLGDRIQLMDSPRLFQEFSGKLDELTRHALQASLQLLIELDPGCRNAKERMDHSGNSVPLPAVVLFHGGDDLVIATKGRFAFPFVRAFAEAIRTNNDWSWAGDNKAIGFSVGVSITHPGFPFRTSHSIANGLLRNAKKVARQNEWTCGAIDYALITESSAEVATILNERSIILRDRTERLNLTGRPWNLAASPASFDSLRAACSELSPEKFPANKLFELRNTLTRSKFCPSGDSPGLVEYDDIADSIMGFIDRWQLRIDRVESTGETWKKVAGLLTDSQRPCYWHADLADAVSLWNPD